MEVSDVCTFSKVPYNVDADFDLPFHGELARIGEVSVQIFQVDNAGKQRGEGVNSKMAETSLRPLWDDGNVVKGGKSKMAFSASAAVRDYEAAGDLFSRMMNEYDLQALAKVKVPVYTGRFWLPVWTTQEVEMFYTCGFAGESSYGDVCPEEWSLTRKSLSAKCEYVCQYDDYPLRPYSYWYPSLYADDRGVDEENIVEVDPMKVCEEEVEARRGR